jgi:hypothetical protein
MRRLLPAVLAALVAVLMLLPAGVAAADVTSDVLVLAVEEGEPQGPEPVLDGENAPEPYEPPFLVHAANGLAASMVALVFILAGLYWVLVHRPAKAHQD